MATYTLSIAALGFVAALLLVQLLVADVLGVLKKHTPGTPVEADHSNVLFRATRTVGNANESIAIFICALLFCFFSSADPGNMALAAWVYATARTLYAVCYYANLQLLRSLTFAVSLMALAALIMIGALSG
ncbi:MAG: MAPEG family protein [Pseudomonadota bacterium]